MRFILTTLAVLLFAGLGGLIAYWTGDPPSPSLMPLDRVKMPNGTARGVVFLLSDRSGWTSREERIAATLTADGIATIGVDTPRYLETIARLHDSCAYLIADVERLSQQFQRASGASAYTAPIVAGIGLGGGLALDLVNQTPEATVGGTLVADPVSAVPLAVDLCTPAGYFTTADGQIYAMHEGLQADPVSVVLSPNVADDISQRVSALQAGSPNVTVIQNTPPTVEAITSLIEAQVADARSGKDFLPVTVLNAVPRHDAMAIILSGDGGWRDIDASIGKSLQADGVPVAGLDSLRYFWSQRTPEQTASDLAALIRKYRATWNVANVILVGYSFGADVLPAAYLALPEVERRHVRLISLLSMSKSADWQITVSGWLGSHGANSTSTLPAARALPMTLVQCVYGIEDENSACSVLGRMGADLVMTEGGHHFGGNYREVAQAILSTYTKRTNGDNASLEVRSIGAADASCIDTSAPKPLWPPLPRAPRLPGVIP